MRHRIMERKWEKSRADHLAHRVKRAAELERSNIRAVSDGHRALAPQVEHLAHRVTSGAELSRWRKKTLVSRKTVERDRLLTFERQSYSEIGFRSVGKHRL